MIIACIRKNGTNSYVQRRRDLDDANRIEAYILYVNDSGGGHLGSVMVLQAPNDGFCLHWADSDMIRWLAEEYRAEDDRKPLNVLLDAVQRALDDLDE